jgi:hypothetical protein
LRTLSSEQRSAPWAALKRAAAAAMLISRRGRGIAMLSNAEVQRIEIMLAQGKRRKTICLVCHVSRETVRKIANGERKIKRRVYANREYEPPDVSYDAVMTAAKASARLHKKGKVS